MNQLLELIKDGHLTNNEIARGFTKAELVSMSDELFHQGVIANLFDEGCSRGYIVSRVREQAIR